MRGANSANNLLDGFGPYWTKAKRTYKEKSNGLAFPDHLASPGLSTGEVP
jgi:hypothetical protein